MMIKSIGVCAFGVVLAILLSAGCKVEITSPPNGRVIRDNGNYIPPGVVSTRDVYDIYYDETWMAVPDEEYIFVGWKKRFRGFCGGSIEPCHLTTADFYKYESLMAILESDEVFYLEPVYEKKNACVGRSVPSSGKKVTLKRGESTVISEVRVPAKKRFYGRRVLNTRFEGCPEGVCSTNGISRVSKYVLREIVFSTKSSTALGTYNIQYIAYTGGFLGCAPFIGCPTIKEKIKKRWRFKLKVVECPD